jgi:predicted CXXCH cytochrome family protein
VVPAWSQSLPSLRYRTYASPSLQASVGQPTGASKVCLSCHDGTIGLGALPGSGAEQLPAYPASERSNLTSDLSDDHPISFAYDLALVGEDPELVSPMALPTQIWLDPDGQMQCTSCHEAHSSTYPKFLVMDTMFSELCTACHAKDGWTRSSHATSSESWDGTGTDPWPHSEWNTVAANGCANCHTPHAAGIGESLLTFTSEEENCLSCHDGSASRHDIASEIRKAFRHPVDRYLDLHEPTEDLDWMPRHVECHDCHDPHAAFSGTATAPNASGPLTGVRGVSSGGSPVEEARYEYELCLRCHGDRPDVPPPFIERQILQPSIRLKIDFGNPSYHPIVEAGLNLDVPSLIYPLDERSIIYCTDCHSNDASDDGGGTGPRGPHGSVWRFLLEREYRTEDRTRESYQAYALCYKCHDRDVILGDRSFPTHKLHVSDDQTPCSVCHDPHGISATQGNPINNTHLINFDTSIVLPDPEGRLEFEDLGEQRGQCFLECHGKIHGSAETAY